MKQVRSPVCSLVGHIDHGKSSILDQLRGTSIIKIEAGGITQCISSTIFPIEMIKKICGDLLKALKLKLTLPGILFLDTPGHAAFNNLRKRGGNLADIAILVIDVNEGIKPQTLECIEILKAYKTPFIIALNKIDLLRGWKSQKKILLENIKTQSENIKNTLDRKLYEIVGKLHELDVPSERFDRVGDYTKQVAIIPISAETGEGLPELLMVLTGLAQKYLESSLKIEVEGPAKGTVLEVNETKGMGTTLDVIIYDGTIKLNDKIVIGGLDKAIVTKVRALFSCAPLTDMRKTKFYSIDQVHAASGIKIAAPDLKEVIPGMPIQVANKNLEKIKKEVQKEVHEVIIETEKEGIVAKADSLGSLEALTSLLKEKKIKIKRASIGQITKKDITEALSEKDSLNKVILGFNIKPVENKNAKVICHDVIYKIIEDFEKWQESEKKRLETESLEKITKPCKIEFLPNCTFRQSNPAVIGVRILGGILKVGTELMKESGQKIGEVRGIQLEKESITESEKGKEVAISLRGVIVGRQINEKDIYFSDLSEEEFIVLKKLQKHLNREEIEILKEIAKIKRKDNPVWGI
ncbi:translation initiation factor IF-2 [archaeon]|nr:translation initiation factor IF-2 [archaeon]